MTDDIKALRDAINEPQRLLQHISLVAACSPDRIARLLDALEAARDALDEIGNDEDCWTAEGMRMIARDALAAMAQAHQ
jgi:hypothetical protein